MPEKINENKAYIKKEISKINNSNKSLKLNMNQGTNINSNNQNTSQKNSKNQELIGIENILKNSNKLSLKKYSTNLDKKIDSLKNKNIQNKNEENNSSQKYNNNYYISKKIKKLSTENTGSSTFQNQKMSKTKMYEEIIKKNMPINNIYYKYTNRNISSNLNNKNVIANDQTIKSPLESLRSNISKNSSYTSLVNKKKIVLNYQKFKNVFLIINDSLSISTNTMIKNTNNNFMKFLYFLILPDFIAKIIYSMMIIIL